MTARRRGSLSGVAAVLLLGVGSLLQAQESAVPDESLVGRNEKNHQPVLIGPMEPGDSIGSGGWRMKNLLVETAEDVQPKIGRGALVFRADAEVSGAKGDYSIHGQLPGKANALGLWVYLEEDANVDKLGIQVYDAQGEALLMLTPADFSGWRWIEFAAAGDHVRQAYPQPDKNGSIDQPLKSQHVVWFAKTAGATRMTVDGMVALVDRSGLEGEEDVTVNIHAPKVVEPGQPLATSVHLVNYTAKPITVDLGYLLQRDSALYSTPLPDPVYGSNHAPGLRSWSVADGETIEEGSLTDGRRWTDAGTAYKANHFAEAFQYVKLDEVRRITKMTWLSGDANHTWLVDVAVSQDGKKFVPVEGLRNVDHHKKWGWQDYPLRSAFEAKVIRFRYHTGDSQKKVPAIRFPSELGLYDGTGDESIALPRVGPILDEGNVKVTVPAGSFCMANLPAETTTNTPAPDAGACLLGIEAAWPGRRTMNCRHIFAALKDDPSLVSADSRLGLNVLSYMFLTPPWASSAPPGTKQDRIITFPPKDPALFGEFCFQVAARYGSTPHPAGALLSSDKRSGLGLVRYYEMWNECNLNPQPTAAWGGCSRNCRPAAAHPINWCESRLYWLLNYDVAVSDNPDVTHVLKESCAVCVTIRARTGG